MVTFGTTTTPKAEHETQPRTPRLDWSRHGPGCSDPAQIYMRRRTDAGGLALAGNEPPPYSFDRLLLGLSGQRRIQATDTVQQVQRRGVSVVQREVDEKQRPRNWGTASAIVNVEVRHRHTGPGVGYSADGEMTPIDIVENTLAPGHYFVSDDGSATGPRDSDYVMNRAPGFAFRHPVAHLHPAMRTNVVITAADRLSALPEYLETYLLSTNQHTDREHLADEGERMMREGITEADIALAADPASAIHTSSREDLVDSLRCRGFTDFPERDEYYRRLAWQLTSTTDFRRWWTKEDIADYWREFPEHASQEWYAFAGKKYTDAKEVETTKWLEAFRRIDAAAGAVNAIAIVTIAVAGSFLGGPAIAGGGRGIAGGMRALQGASFKGVPASVWLKTLGGAGLSASYLNAIITRSEEAAKHGDTNPLTIVAAAVNDAMGSGRIYESVTNESLLTGEDLKLTTAQRVIGALTGGLELGLNALGAKDFVPESLPNSRPPVAPTPDAPGTAASKTTSLPASDPILAKPPVNTNTPTTKPAKTYDPWAAHPPANKNAPDDLTAARLNRQGAQSPPRPEANVAEIPLAPTGTGEIVATRTTGPPDPNRAQHGASGARMSADKPTQGPTGSGTGEMTPARGGGQTTVGPPTAGAPPRPVIDPGGRGIFSLEASTLSKLSPGDAARVRELEVRLPRSDVELTELVRLRTKANGAPLPEIAGTPEHMLARWTTYKAPPRNGSMSFTEWAAGHPSRMKNTKAGLAAEARYRAALAEESVSSRAAVVKTKDGKPRQVDVLVDADDGTADLIQIKSGKESLTTTPRQSGGTSSGTQSLSNADALARDAELIAEGNRVTWVFEQVPSGPLVARAREQGVSVIIRVDDAAARIRMIGLMKKAKMSDDVIATVTFVEGSVDDVIHMVVSRLTAPKP